MQLKLFKKGFNYSQDGPGNRLVYHLHGCNMRCPWCANPEGMHTDGPHARSPLLISETDELVREILSCAPMFFEGGGVTFTGGEPTMQFEALKALLTALKEHGIHTALETNGTHARLLELFPLIDYLMMDFKYHDDAVHRHITGVSNEHIKQNIAAAAAARSQLHIRTPLIGGFNASEQDAHDFATFFETIDCTNTVFEFLSYHEYGREKWQQCGMEYTMENAFVSDETVAHFEAVFAQHLLRTVRT